jgi:hypothetical protein
MVEHAQDYPWSSAQALCGLRAEVLLSTEFPPPDVIGDWATWLGEERDERAIDRIHRQTNTGRPCGTLAFATRLESLLGRASRPGKPSRKLKQRARPQDPERKTNGNP